jgi:hypothetical protein
MVHRIESSRFVNGPGIDLTIAYTVLQVGMADIMCRYKGSSITDFAALFSGFINATEDFHYLHTVCDGASRFGSAENAIDVVVDFILESFGKIERKVIDLRGSV